MVMIPKRQFMPANSGPILSPAQVREQVQQIMQHIGPLGAPIAKATGALNAKKKRQARKRETDKAFRVRLFAANEAAFGARGGSRGSQRMYLDTAARIKSAKGRDLDRLGYEFSLTRMMVDQAGQVRLLTPDEAVAMADAAIAKFEAG